MMPFPSLRRSPFRRAHLEEAPVRLPGGAVVLALSVLLLSALLACTDRNSNDGKLHLTYWEKWTRFEGEAMQRVVQRFNSIQDNIVVHYVSTSAVDRKTLVATAGGDPPDIAGMWLHNMHVFADQGALQPLDGYLQRDSIRPDNWRSVYIEGCRYRGQTWALPSLGSMTALHWNRAMFRDSAVELRAAGLDPNRAPATLEEFDQYIDILTKRDANGELIQIGFLPQEPNWFVWAYPEYFGGSLFKGGRITANHPLNVEALEWVRKQSLKYGRGAIEKFTSGFGNFASAQNAFLSGKVAMVFQGEWMYNFIREYAPGMEWGVAPWPKTPHGPARFTTAEVDILVIPSGVPKRRADAAWEFLRFVSTEEAQEIVCLGHRKSSTLSHASREFMENHPHPYVNFFAELSRSPAAIRYPGIGVWTEYEDEWMWAFEQVRLLEAEPQEALDAVQAKMEKVYAKHEAAFARWTAAREKRRRHRSAEALE